MSAIEKVCELTGDYPGSAMYTMKRNHIQVASKHRHQFRGHKATLYVFKHRTVIMDSECRWDTKLKCINPNPTEEDWESSDPELVVMYKNGLKTTYSVFYDNLRQYKAALRKRHERLATEYEYVLHVPSLEGEVEGWYSNCSTDMSAVIRRLGRLVGHRNLTVKYKAGDAYDFMENN